MRKTEFSLFENKGTNQLHSNCEADQRLCFCYTDSKIPPLLMAKISSFCRSSETVQAGLCRTGSDFLKSVFFGIMAQKMTLPSHKP